MSTEVKPEAKPETKTAPAPSQEMQQVMQDLINEALLLALDTLDNSCNCVFYQRARKIAKLVKKIMLSRGLQT
ncbi:MAG: hypothetical protein DRJ40_11070 [Thermoprotei archaeon]|nr:MAG: hypothetical protein DRJ40_11070 [Thermoprotei archaeon]